MRSVLAQHAVQIFRAAVRAADPRRAVLRYFRREDHWLFAGAKRYNLRRFSSIYVVGAGKASAAMARAVEDVLGDRVTAGLINVPEGTQTRLKRIESNASGHPIPDERGMQGAERIAAMVRPASEHDLVVCLISGGASALMPLPAPPITLEQKREITSLLLRCGADIHELNCVRKHLSRIKGGQLARLVFPATLITLILSDVIGDPLDVIGSGPTAPDASSAGDARKIIEKYALKRKVPTAIWDRLSSPSAETPKPGDPAFARTQNIVVGSNRLALDAASVRARELGYGTEVLSSYVQGEAREVAHVHAAIAREIDAHGRPRKRPACILSGGETTVTVRGPGKGGRNQEFVLAAAIDIAGLREVVILSGGTDGMDGPTDAAGAICDGLTVERARVIGMDARGYLAENNAYCFFDQLGDLLKTGPTGTNVMDVQIILAGIPARRPRAPRLLYRSRLN